VSDVTFPDADLIADRVYLDRPGTETLYRSATGLEKALADSEAERLIRIYAEAIVDVWDPYKISFTNLPFLAWAMGVNLWQDEWHQTTKRSWIARQWTFKSLRGTEAGIRMAIDYVGRDVSPWGYKVLRITVPPQRVYSGPSLRREEREEWLKIMPQLRIWRTQESGHADYKSFYGGSSTGRRHNQRFCLGGERVDAKLCCITPSTAIERLRRRARWIVRGVETDVHVTEFGSYWRLHLRGIEGASVFTSRPIVPNRRFFIPSTAAKRLVTIMPKERLAWRTPVWASLEPMTAEPERVSIGGQRRRSVFCDLIMRQRAYYAPSDAWSRIYQRYAVNDGSVELNSRRPTQFMGLGRYGFPKYTAWVGVSLRGLRKWAVFDGIPHQRFYQPHDPTPVKRARAAVLAAKKIADRILLELGPVPSFVAGRPFLAEKDRFIVGRTL
jgi:phage tail P2-like protein